jgi:hypothetical protein
VPSSGFALAMYAIAETFGLRRADLHLDALGSTPRRLEALREGRCDATMLNAGNELPAEAAGCRLVASVADVCPPYVGTVLCVHGEEHLDAARRLAAALLATARDVTGDDADAASVAAEEAASRLHLPEDLAARYVERLSSPDEGLILGDEPDLAGLRTIVELRRRFLPTGGQGGDGTDVLAAALEPASGLVDAGSSAR